MARKPLAEMGRTELEDLPDWIFDPPRGRLNVTEEGALAVTFDGETPTQWRKRRDDCLRRAGLPGIRESSGEFRRAFREEARCRRPCSRVLMTTTDVLAITTSPPRAARTIRTEGHR